VPTKDQSGSEQTKTASRSIGVSPKREDEIIRRWTVRALGDADRAQAVTAESGVFVVGTDPSAHIRLSDKTVSRKHVQLTFLPEGILVADQGSKNGTKIGRRRIERELAFDGDTITIGHTKLRVSVEEERPTQVEGPRRFGDFLTAAPAMIRVLDQIERVADSQVSVLLEGETGTGKDVLAQAIHSGSARKNGPFTIVDVGAIAKNLIEGQLFGHVKGAFTGAMHDREGAFESSNGGTIFLDEIGELSLEMQPKLLRALESRRIKRVGENAERPIDVRIVSATHRDLRAMAKAGTFRADLLFRVAVASVRIPPLRERAEDIAHLARHFISAMGADPRQLTRAAERTLAQYSWPGNSRELRNVLERALTMVDKRRIAPADLFPPGRDLAPPSSQLPFHQAKESMLDQFERFYVKELLERHRGNVSQAARAAGLTRNALYALMKRVGEA
jgi:DNA-binding NtrC family response regulator